MAKVIVWAAILANVGWVGWVGWIFPPTPTMHLLVYLIFGSGVLNLIALALRPKGPKGRTLLKRR